MPVIPQLDPVNMEQLIATAIRDTFLSDAFIARYAQVHMRERFPDSDEDDLNLTTVPDPVNADVNMTSVIQIGIPTVREVPYTSEQNTKLTLEYPITYDLAVKDLWDNSDGNLTFNNSRDLFMSIYLKGRQLFKGNREVGGFQNCFHDYLQQEHAGTVEDEESGSLLHVADWALTVYVEGVVV